MGLREYNESKALHEEGHSFHGLLMAAMRKADTTNFELLRTAFPDTATELQARYDAPGGRLPTEQPAPRQFERPNGILEYFVTFGQQYAREPHPDIFNAHPNGWVVVEAGSFEEAKDTLTRQLQDHYSNIYAAADFTDETRKTFPLGELGRIPSRD